jgi:hypothetical protein
MDCNERLKNEQIRTKNMVNGSREYLKDIMHPKLTFHHQVARCLTQKKNAKKKPKINKKTTPKSRKKKTLIEQEEESLVFSSRKSNK